MKYSIKTHRGLVRPTNQDNCCYLSPDENSCFALVCDGMGGENAGDTASVLGTQYISGRISDGWHANMTTQSAQNLLTTAITAANICIYDEATENPEYSGMGSTVVALVCIGRNAVIAHAGDSRAYVLSDTLKRVTKDHSYVQELVDSGLISSEEADNHPDKNYITRALGVSEKINIDFNELVLNPGDKILLCSDGLTNYVTEDAICNILKNTGTEDAALVLVDAALENGGGDNVSTVVVEI